MSKAYLNKKTMLSVVSGKIESISDNRQEATISYQEYDYNKKTSSTKEVHAQTMLPFDDSYQVGQKITMLGGFVGNDFSIRQYSNTNACFEVPDLAVVTGYVISAKLNEELNQDGTHKLKRSDNTPKKPHFDITIRVMDGEREVNHVVKVYNAMQYVKDGEPSQIDKIKSRFENVGFKDSETTPIRATIATAPGQEWSYTNNDIVYNYCGHIGIRSLDLELEYARNREQSSPNKTTPPAPEVPKSEPQPVVVEGFDPDTPVDGFDEDLSAEFV